MIERPENVIVHASVINDNTITDKIKNTIRDIGHNIDIDYDILQKMWSIGDEIKIKSLVQWAIELEVETRMKER